MTTCDMLGHFIAASAPPSPAATPPSPAGRLMLRFVSHACRQAARGHESCRVQEYMVPYYDLIQQIYMITYDYIFTLCNRLVSKSSPAKFTIRGARTINLVLVGLPPLPRATSCKGTGGHKVTYRGMSPHQPRHVPRRQGRLGGAGRGAYWHE